MAYKSKAYALTSKSPPASFLERSVELRRATGINLTETDYTTKDIFTTVSDLGLFIPTELILVCTAISGMTVQPQVTFMGETFTCTLTTVDDYMICQLGTVRKVAVAASSVVFFTVPALATATTYTVAADVRGYYAGA